MVSFMLSSFGPPVAIIGKSGYRFLISLTMYAVLLAPDILSIVAPELILASISSYSDTTVTTIGYL